MRIVLTILTITILSGSLSACYTLAVGAAGAGGGYILSNEQDKKDGDKD